MRQPRLHIVPVVLMLVCGQGHADRRIAAIQATTEIPPAELLDVGIEVFNPGVSLKKTRNESEEMGVFRDLRESEARFIPYHLKNTLESTGQWGAVRVLPRDTGVTDVLVRGRIVKSTGLELRLVIRVEDATGRVWREVEYRREVDPMAYDERAVGFGEPYQDLYNKIANSIRESRDKLSTNEIYRIREVSRLRFAAELVPAVYGDYLSATRSGKLVIENLPADDDPMIARADLIRSRDNMFIDTVNEYYAGFYVRMQRSYSEFRKFSYEEERALKRQKSEATKRKWLGGLLILGGILADADSYAGQAAKEAAVIGGYMTIRSGFQMSEEAKIHVAAMRELAASFDMEVAPMLVDVEGETLRLQGSAESQYQEWSQLLTEIFKAETGLPGDTDAAPASTPAAGDLN
ncbi:MAG: hypothetical protein O7A04_03870 [Acidobacteria bacterium]|nr:hypothetical protein [Acidobacteriota bacterium]